MNKFHLSLKIATPLLFLGLSGFADSAETANSKPDIVIIIADDIGYSDFGCYGGEIPTPNIDRIAARGIRFTHYYAENMCAPSRAALLTGQYHIRGYNNGNNITIPEAISTAGYVSYAVGKWHNAGEEIMDRHAPLKRGFGHFYGTPQGTSNFYAPITLTRDGEPAEKEWEENKNFYYTDAITDRTDNFRYVEWRDGKDNSLLVAELYDHRKDSLETINVANDEGYKEIVIDLAKQLKDGWKAALPDGITNNSNNPLAPPAVGWGSEANKNSAKNANGIKKD